MNDERNFKENEAFALMYIRTNNIEKSHISPCHVKIGDKKILFNQDTDMFMEKVVKAGEVVFALN